MKYVFGAIFIVLVVGVIYFNSGFNQNSGTGTTPPQSNIPVQNTPGDGTAPPFEIPQSTVITTGLDTPWAIAFLPDGGMLVTERPGRVRFISADGKLNPEPVARITRSREIGEGGLLGIALHPDFPTNRFVYLYYTYNGSGNNTNNRVVRMTYDDNSLTDEIIIVDSIPGASNHNGGRIKFGPDGFLYITTGDAQEPSRSQDANSLAGKILRVTDSGKPASGNPLGNSTFSYGHRNAQGLAWDTDDRLWSTEHGPSGGESGRDELNLIQAGKNYGWPEITGNEIRQGMVSPVKNSGTDDTWAPGGTAIVGNVLYFSGLRGEALYKTELQGENAGEIRVFFKGEFGRIREIISGPNGMLYMTTSNRDGRGQPDNEDDRIIRVNPGKLETQ